MKVAHLAAGRGKRLVGLMADYWVDDLVVSLAELKAVQMAAMWAVQLAAVKDEKSAAV